MSTVTSQPALYERRSTTRLNQFTPRLQGDSIAIALPGSVADSAEALPSLAAEFDVPERPVYEFCKRVLDVALCLALLPIAVPIIGLCALLVWIESPGRVLFRQARTGKDGCRFRMFKLRTMVANAEELKEKYRHLNELTWPDFKISNDPRVTRVGRFLRKTSLDELPQLFNVLLGDMSLVGPRPTSFSADTYQPWQYERLTVTPGITGLWQIQGRANIDFDDRVRLDIKYVRNRGFWLDVKILFATIFAVLQQKGAK